MNSLDDLVLLILLLLVLFEKFDLLERVLVRLELVNVEGLDDEEHKHDWAHAELGLFLLGHVRFRLFVSDSHEDFLEGVTLLLGNEVYEDEDEEGEDDLSDEPLSTPQALELNDLLAHAADGEDNTEDHKGKGADALENIEEEELVS